jgi:5-methylcytosine-specific restriction endonuclease McrA
MNSLASLDDEALLASLRSLIQSHRRVTSDIVAYLGEVDVRRIHVARGFSSLFEYCIKELGFSEDEAYRRIEVARMARRYPMMLGLLRVGTVTLSTLALLKHHIEPGNAAELLAFVSGVSVKVAKERLASKFPLPPVAESVRKLPAPGPAFALPDTRTPTGVAKPVAEATAREEPAVPDASTETPRCFPPAAPTPRAVLEPRAEGRFLVKVTLTRAARDKLELARDLTRHRHPEGRLEVVLEAALDALLEKLERQRFGRADHPHKAPRSKGSENPSRTVPRASRRTAIQRDGIQCAFVSDCGRRCEARAFLEFDHATPIGRGGGPESSNIRVLCRAHNRLAAERAYGRNHVEAAIVEAQQGRSERHPRHRS